MHDIVRKSALRSDTMLIPWNRSSMLSSSVGVFCVCGWWRVKNSKVNIHLSDIRVPLKDCTQMIHQLGSLGLLPQANGDAQTNQTMLNIHAQCIFVWNICNYKKYSWDMIFILAPRINIWGKKGPNRHEKCDFYSLRLHEIFQ